MIKQNPFSVYDFMGYFIPGALLIFLYIFIDNLDNSGYNLMITDFFNIKGNFQVEDFLFFIIISYSLGHLVNFLSSMSIEKYALWKYDYPSKFLLGFEKKAYWRKNNMSGYLWRVLLPIFILPVAFFDLFIGELFNLKDIYTRKLDDLLVELIKHKGLLLVNKLFEGNNTQIKLREFDFFRVFAHYAYENSANHQEKLNNYVALYGFLRTLTLISVITFWYSIYSSYRQGNNFVDLCAIAIIGFISYIFFMAFMKFYRRYTLEGLMVVATDKDID